MQSVRCADIRSCCIRFRLASERVLAEGESMSGPELIAWLLHECKFKKIPPTDSAMILVLRELPDIEASVRTIRHRGEGQGDER
jgi:hypothetical protein